MNRLSYQDFMQEIHIRNNNLLNKICWIITSLGPLIFLLKVLHIFQNDNLTTPVIIFALSLIIAIIHTIYKKHHPFEESTTILGLISIDFMICIMYSITININMSWFFVPMLSLLCCQPNSYYISSATNFVLMVASFYINMDYRSSRDTMLDGFDWLIDSIGGFAVEYFFMFITGLFICNLIKWQIQEMYGNQQVIATTEKVSQTDLLTGLWKHEYLKEQFNSIEPTDKTGLALIVIDMDNFKKLNDEFGHSEGNRALILFANLLQTLTKNYQGSIVSRFGGDEFTLLIPHINDNDTLKLFLELLQKKSKSVFHIDPILNIIHFSMGAILISNPEMSFKDAFTKADNCLLEVKQNGKDGYKIYSSQ